MTNHLLSAYNRDDVIGQRRDFTPDMLVRLPESLMAHNRVNYMTVDGPYISRQVLGVNTQPRELIRDDIVEVFYHGQFEHHEMDFMVGFNKSPDHKIAPWVSSGWSAPPSTFFPLHIDFTSLSPP